MSQPPFSDRSLQNPSAFIIAQAGLMSNAKKCLIEAEAHIIMRNDERVKYLCSIINAILHNEPISYENAALSGTSYQKMIDHVYLDLRVW